MKFLTFDGETLREGMSVMVMADAMKAAAKKNPNATLDDLPGVACLNWHKKAGKGAIEIEVDGATTVVAMPSKGPTFLPAGCVARLRPAVGAGFTLGLSANGAHDIAAGADAVLESRLMPKDGDAPMRVNALNWLREGRVGASSYTLCARLTGVTDPQRTDDADNPWDGGDFARCDKFFKAVPEARAKIGEMAAVSPQWAALAPAWSELEGLLAQEQAGGEPKLGQRMSELLERPSAKPRGRQP